LLTCLLTPQTWVTVCFSSNVLLKLKTSSHKIAVELLFRHCDILTQFYAGEQSSLYIYKRTRNSCMFCAFKKNIFIWTWKKCSIPVIWSRVIIFAVKLLYHWATLYCYRARLILKINHWQKVHPCSTILSNLRRLSDYSWRKVSAMSKKIRLYHQRWLIQRCFFLLCQTQHYPNALYLSNKLETCWSITSLNNTYMW